MSMTLPELLHELDEYKERVPLEVLSQMMRDTKTDLSELDEFIHFGDKHYQRNLVYHGEGFMALLLCWRSGQRSAVHDHTGSTCGVKVLKGSATETVFDLEGEQLRPTRTRQLRTGQVCASQDSDIHQISNMAPGEGDLITLHIYSPPLLKMNVYSLTEKTVKQEVEAVCDTGSRILPKLRPVGMER